MDLTDDAYAIVTGLWLSPMVKSNKYKEGMRCNFNWESQLGLQGLGFSYGIWASRQKKLPKRGCTWLGRIQTGDGKGQQ